MTKAILLDYKNGITVLDMEEVNTLPRIYDQLNCTTITAVTLPPINGRIYQGLADDESLLKNEPRCILYVNDTPWIHDALIITEYNEFGEQIGLTNKEVKQIINALNEHLVSDGQSIWRGFTINVNMN